MPQLRALRGAPPAKNGTMHMAKKAEAYERNGQGAANGLSFLGFCAIFLVIGTGATASRAAGPILTPSELVNRADLLPKEELSIRGVLQNAGSNYFTDRRIVLKDEKNTDSFVYVQGGPPVELPPGQGNVAAKPRILSDLLGKEVILKGTLDNGIKRGVGPTTVFRVNSIELPK